MPEPEWETVELQVRERVAWITLNRPGALNAVTPDSGRELVAAVERAATDSEVRVLVTTGAGRGFCSGADLNAPGWRRADGVIDFQTPLQEIFHPLVLALRTLDKPVIAAVNGPAVGFGCSLALAADIVVAAESSYFLAAFASVGLTLDGGASALLTGRVGHARACEMALLAERVLPAEALSWGLVNRVAPDTELEPVVSSLAAGLATGAPGSYAATKRSLNAAMYPRLVEILDLEAVLQQERAESSDFAEGARAFADRRSPHFTGD